ncbi:MAG: hypothetical protein AMS27_03455, partial [Bacteroides sp. SM23_62_1]
MKRTRIFTFLLFAGNISFCNFSLFAQNEKIPLNHSIYEGWKTLSNAKISNNGQWVAYEINPQQGDGYLYLVDLNGSKTDSVPRGYNPVFSNQSDFLVFKIKPQYATVRQAKKDKKKKSEMPKDTLAIWLLDGSDPLKIADVESFKVPEDGEGWFIFQHYEKKDTAKSDTVVSDSSHVQKSKEKSRGNQIVIMDPVQNKMHLYDHVVSYDVSKKGNTFGFIQESSDTIPVCKVSFFDTEKEKLLGIFEAPGKIARIGIDEPGTRMTFLYHH